MFKWQVRIARLPLFVNTYQHRRFPISPLKQLLHGWLSEVCKTSKVDGRRHFDEMWVIAAYLEAEGTSITEITPGVSTFAKA